MKQPLLPYKKGNDGAAFAFYIQEFELYHADFTIECYQHMLTVGLIRHDYSLSQDTIENGDKFWADFLHAMEVAQLEVRTW